MATNDAIAAVLSSGLSLLGLAYLYFWLYRDYRRDLLRTRLFKIRGELFDAAAKGRIDFDHPAYGLLRSTLNGFVRSGHRIGAWRLLMSALFLDAKEVEELYQFRARWHKAVSTLSPDVRDWMEDLRRQTHESFFNHLLATTGFFYLVIVLWLAFRDAQKRERRRPRTPRPEGVTVPTPPASFTYRLDSLAWANAA